jgi:transcription elongation factor Elf1
MNDRKQTPTQVDELPEKVERHLACPFCGSYAVDRLYVASAHVDACRCWSCQASWDEDAASGSYRLREDRASVLIPRERQIGRGPSGPAGRTPG